MNNYLVSFCVPVYKIDMPRVKRCLNSILRCGLDKDKYEVIIVDDGNTEEYEKDLENTINEIEIGYNFQFIKHPKNLHLFQARKTAISHATGEYICHVDSDDWLEPNCLIDLENLLKIQPDLVRYLYCTHEVNYITEWYRFGIKNENDLHEKYTFTENKSVDKALIDIITHKYDTPLWGKLFKREIFLKDWDNLPAPNMCVDEDVVWTIHTYPYIKSICCANIKMYHYDRTSDSITSFINKITKYKIERQVTVKYSIDDFLKKVNELTINERIRKAAFKFELSKVVFYYKVLMCDNIDIFDSPETKEYGIKRFEEVFGKETMECVKLMFEKNPWLKLSNDEINVIIENN